MHMALSARMKQIAMTQLLLLCYLFLISIVRYPAAPEPFSVNKIPNQYGWGIAPTLWETALTMIEDEGLDVQVVDAREPLMQSVHAHPPLECLHFCMNSAAVNMYLDMYWNEVYSKFNDVEP